MPLRRIILPLLAAAFVTASVTAQDRTPVYSSMAEAYAKGDTAKVLSLILDLRRKEPDVFGLNGYGYLAGRAFETSGDAASASAWFAEAAAADSPLGAYALWRLSRTMRRTGNLPAERLFLLEASTLESDSAVSQSANARLFASYFESGDNSEVVRLSRFGPFTKVSSSGTDPTNAGSEALQDLERILLPTAGKALFRTGNPDEARTTYEKAIATVDDPEQPDDIALQAVEGLDQIDFAGDRTAAGESLDAEIHFQRAEIYQFNRRFRAARVHYRAIFEKHRESERAPHALFQIGVGFASDRDYHNAIEWFERLQGEYPDNQVSVDALYETAGAYANVNKPKESASRYEKFLDEHPYSDRAAGAFLNLIDLYRDAGEAGEALKWTERMRLAYPAGDEAAEALFARAKVHMSQNDWEDALADVEALFKEGSAPDRAFLLEIGFLRGFNLEKLGRPYPAADAYVQVPCGLGSYYGWRATERLRRLNLSVEGETSIPGQYLGYMNLARATLDNSNAREIKFAASSALRMADSESDRRELTRILGSAYKRLPEYEVSAHLPVEEEFRQAPLKSAVPDSKADHRAIADALFFLGIFDEGAAELEIAKLFDARARATSVPLRDKRLLAEYYRRGGFFRQSVEETERTWRGVPDDYPLEFVPAEDLRKLYPAAFKGLVLHYSDSEGIDPRFLLSIMRQESRFDPSAKSPAAARGLMQFISSTASETAEEAGLTGFVREDLYDPATSILLGAHYLAKLFREFPGEHAAVAASYNAGEDRMLRWYRRSHSTDPDRYVPEIRFGQTKDYVRKVMANYRAYEYLYDARLNLIADETEIRIGW